MTTATITGTWKADPAHSSVVFTMRNFLGTVIGRCDLTEARVEYDELAGAATVDAFIDATSITTGSEQRDGHLRSGELLDTATHPTIAFSGSELQTDEAGEHPTGRLTGDLTVRGVTNKVSLRLTSLGRDTFPLNGQEAMVVVGEAELSRGDFGLAFNMPWNDRMLMGDSVEIRIELLLLRDGPEAAQL